MVKIDQIQKTLAEAGFNSEEELLNLESSRNGFEIPRVRIEHKDSGKHRLYIDHGDNYLGDDSQEETLPENTFQAVVFAEQSIRALWEENEPLPICSGIDGKPTISDPVSRSCLNCPESIIGQGKCKPKIRLWLLLERDSRIMPFVMSLSPTSIKHWHQHKRKLKRSKLPVVSVNTVFGLLDVKKNSYRWAEVNFDVASVPSLEMLQTAKQARDELDRVMQDITARDFEDAGDQSES
jgi:hypothetical protein